MQSQKIVLSDAINASYAISNSVISSLTLTFCTVK